MAGYYSILRFVNNSLTDESIALGLVVLTAPELGQEGRAMFRLSETKVDFAKKLNPSCAKLLAFSLNQLERFFKQDLRDQSEEFMQSPIQVHQMFIERLATYNNGIIQFTEPTYIESSLLFSAFDRYFDRFIEANIVIKNKVIEETTSMLKQKVVTDLYDPLRGTVDVDYTLRKKQLPALFFDYHLDALGVNGAMYAVKAIDLNANHHLDTIQRELAEFESVIDRLNRFAKEHNITGIPEYHLVVDPPQKANRDRKELYEILQSTNQFILSTSSRLSRIAAQIRKRKARKFSEVLLEV